MKQYQVIYADPPWSYDNKKTGGGMKSGAVNKYPTMPLLDIMAMKIPAEKNAVLFLWVTVPLIQYGFQVMESWGFKYKTMLTWQKKGRFGMGYWYRGQCEHLLFGVKGGIKAFRMQESNFISIKAGKHSAKPEEFRKLIERSTLLLKNKLELFARNETEGWDVYGNQVNNSIIL